MTSVILGSPDTLAAASLPNQNISPFSNLGCDTFGRLVAKQLLLERRLLDHRR